MIAATSKVLIGTALCCACLSFGAAFGAQADKTGDDTKTPSPPDEEIIVRGQAPAELRLAVKHAEEAFYDRFNAINRDDEFDIHCRQEQTTGSHFLRRICVPNFWRDLLAKSAEQTTRERQSGGGFDSPYAVDSQRYFAEAQFKRALLAQKIRKAVGKDEELQLDLVRLTRLRQALNESLRQTTASVRKTAAQAALPYGAAVEADVRIGRKPWRHALTQRTFTFAHVDGTIRTIDVECRRHTERLRFRGGVEWTLPDDWGRCALRVHAPPGTTFALYEFD